jgi:hypothetical protein
MTASLTTSHRSSGALTGDRHALERAGLRPLPPLSAPAPLHLVAPEGQLQVHTASYRGSFSSVLSQAMRAAGLGSRVLIAQFLKAASPGCVRIFRRVLQNPISLVVPRPSMRSGRLAGAISLKATLINWCWMRSVSRQRSAT